MSVVPAKGSFRGQAKDRAWTLSVKANHAPQRVPASGTHLSAQAYTWGAGSKTLTVTQPKRDAHVPVTVTYW